MSPKFTFWPQLVWVKFLSPATMRPNLSGLLTAADRNWPWNWVWKKKEKRKKLGLSSSKQSSYPLPPTTNSFGFQHLCSFLWQNGFQEKFLQTYTSGQSCSRAWSSSEQADCILQRERRGHLISLLGKEETSAVESERVVSPKNSKQQMETLSIMKSFDQ